MGSFGNIHDSNGNIKVVPSPWPEGIGSGGGNLTLSPNIAYYITGVNSNINISIDTSSVLSDFETRYNVVFEYVSGTVTVPSTGIHWNVDWTSFTFEANNWYEIDIKRIGGNNPVLFGIVMKYES